MTILSIIGFVVSVRLVILFVKDCQKGIVRRKNRGV